MTGFDEAWAAVAHPYDGENVSPELRPLLRQLYFDISKIENLAAIKSSLVKVLEYLNGKGRTNANCWAVDMFFCTSEGWEQDWTERDMPEDLHDVLSLMGQALHDTVKAPAIAENFDCLPEQLLARVRAIKAP